MPLGLYISVPFCRTKCTYCNFASEVFSRVVFESYVTRVCCDLQRARTIASETGGRFEDIIDSVYLGGGTPTVLDSHQLQRLFVTIRQNFCLDREAEITVECAPGTLSAGMIATLTEAGVNRVSLGVQSFVDAEAASVGRLHKRETVLEEIARLRTAGISNINIDLIAGLPHQTAQSWEFSLNEVIGSGVPHVSVYILEIDEESRLGRELIAGGTRYHAHSVPDEDLTADLYLLACDRLNSAGVKQYEISNFARPAYESRHNLKYWTRQRYMGFGVDAHSMLQGCGDVESVRLATADALEKYVAGTEWKRTLVSRQQALEETFFLGLRLNRGVDLDSVERQFGAVAVAGYAPAIDELVNDGLLDRNNSHISLTSRGRLLSNEVFEKFVFEGAL
jgi:putative oxygen-independent coproporphyrinogen III oxidase